MKLSIALSIFIFVIGLGIGLRDRQQLAALRENHARIAAEAAALGISSDPGNPAGRLLVTRRSVREDKQAVAKRFGAELIALVKENDALEKAGGTLDQAAQKRYMELMEGLARLDAEQLKSVIADLRAATDLNDEMRKGLLGLCIMSLANHHPQAALELLTGSTGFFKDKMTGEHVLAMALGSWAGDDPVAAMEWLRKNAAEIPGFLTDKAKNAIVAGAAKNDPVLAFQVIRQLKLGNAQEAVSDIFAVASTAEERTSALAALRQHLAGITDKNELEKLMGTAVLSLTYSTVREGFNAATRWISDAGFSADQLETISSNLFTEVKPSETRQWIEWVGENLPPDKADDPIQLLVHNWTLADHQAAGTWLANTPDGPTKQSAVRSYAETVASYDPQTAARWALTLPADEKRVHTLQRIHERWPTDDANGAAAFAKEHGITP